MVEAKIKASCRFGCRAGCRSGCRAKIPKALILRHFSLSDNHDNQYYKEKGNSKKIVSPDKEKRFSDVRCRNFVVRPFLVGLFHSRRNRPFPVLLTIEATHLWPLVHTQFAFFPLPRVSFLGSSSHLSFSSQSHSDIRRALSKTYALSAI